MNVITRALLALLILASAWCMRAHAIDQTITSTVYLPLVICQTCAGSGHAIAPTPLAPQPTLPITPTPAPGTDAAEVIRLVNIERAKVGCPAVAADPDLIAATQAWSEYMQANSYYHHATASWYARYHYPSGVMENIGGVGIPSLTVEAWMASPMHRNNLLWCYEPSDPSYNPADVYVAGVGHAGPYWTWGMALYADRR